MKKKVLSIFLVMVMALSLVPMTVFAENTPTSIDTEAALRTAANCQAKCNTLVKKSTGETKPRHLRGRLFIKSRTTSSLSLVRFLKS